MSEKVANGVLSGALKVSGFFTSSVVNSRAGKKFFSLLPGEIVLASLDGFGTHSATASDFLNYFRYIKFLGSIFSPQCLSNFLC